ncbi:uncharacterized protein LOC113227882 isoform X2 [Hyposmocoma kahamanoa]|uniref:uncharacterized protein LOC113227882 isoform X2 n=1 Tax=Hyposmocoma kahamanoa TaxID=1477025 RepID=UPI000E6D5EB8|nr:uncharacterized protein LOC113227882 isoform X2 [Hyposmocoma kahamanoa]
MLGPADMHFKTVTECEQPVNIVQFAVTQKKYNRTMHLLDITLSTPIPIGNDMIIEIKGSIKKQGGYKPGGLYMKEPACKTLSLLMGDLFINILQAAGVEECPLPAGDHKALDFYFDNENFKVHQVYGEYRTEVLLYKDDELQLCSLLYYDLVPKSK